jgi:hypothetical protein
MRSFGLVQLAACAIPFVKALQQPGEFMLTYPKSFHQGFNLGWRLFPTLSAHLLSTSPSFLRVRLQVLTAQKRLTLQQSSKCVRVSSATTVFVMPLRFPRSWIEIGRSARLCKCRPDYVYINVDELLRKLQRRTGKTYGVTLPPTSDDSDSSGCELGP